MPEYSKEVGRPWKLVPWEREGGLLDTEEKTLSFSLEPSKRSHVSGSTEPHVILAHEFGHYKTIRAGEDRPGWSTASAFADESNAWRYAIIDLKRSGNWDKEARKSAIDSLQTSWTWGLKGYQEHKAKKLAERLIGQVEKYPGTKITPQAVIKIAREIGFKGGGYVK